jgi:hypothetical protein
MVPPIDEVTQQDDVGFGSTWVNLEVVHHRHHRSRSSGMAVQPGRNQVHLSLQPLKLVWKEVRPFRCRLPKPHPCDVHIVQTVGPPPSDQAGCPTVNITQHVEVFGGLSDRRLNR